MASASAAFPVGGIVKNRLWFGNQLLRTDHLSHTCLPQNAFSRGEPEEGRGGVGE